MEPKHSPVFRVHPLAPAAFALALGGIVLVGCVTGPVAVALAGAALWKIGQNPALRGRGLALAAVVVGMGDLILWAVILSLVVPSGGMEAGRPLDKISLPLHNLPAEAPPAIAKALESNVRFVVETRGRFLMLGTESFTGSGIVIGKDGNGSLILTSRHVVDPSYRADRPGSVDTSSSITVHFVDGSKKPAHICWTAPEGVDLALTTTGPNGAAVSQEHGQAVAAMQIGDRVFAVGNPHDLGWTYTEGVLSGVREFRKGSLCLTLLQTQTPINEGNSGGGLYLADGTLVGIVTWTQEKSRAEGISFAISYGDFLKMYGGNPSGTD